MVKTLKKKNKGNAVSLEFDRNFLNKIIVQSDCEDMESIIKKLFGILDKLIIEDAIEIGSKEYLQVLYG